LWACSAACGLGSPVPIAELMEKIFIALYERPHIKQFDKKLSYIVVYNSFGSLA
jgi:hypothetical protein